MTLRLLNSGRGEERDLVVAYHAGLHDSSGRPNDAGRRLIAAAPDAIIITDVRMAGQRQYVDPHKFAELDAWALHAANGLAVRRRILTGWSEGCQAIRAALARGEVPDAVVPADGTHTSTPPDYARQVTPWSDYAAAARRCDGVMVASHTSIVPPGYASTTQTMRLITGWALQDAGPDDAPARRADGCLVVYSYAGRDAPAHVYQLHHALPAMVGEALELLDAANTTPTAPTLPSPRMADFGLAVLEEAQSDLKAGVWEDLGRNDGTWLRQVYGSAPGANWCASAATSWVRRAAAALGIPSPVPGSAGARALMEQVKAAAGDACAQFIPGPAVRLADLHPGMLVFWDRSVAGRPDTSWWGHVGVVADVGLDGFAAIEGNSGADGRRVARMQRRLPDRLLGVGRLTPRLPAITMPSATFDADTARRLNDLQNDVMLGGGLPDLDKLKGDS